MSIYAIMLVGIGLLTPILVFAGSSELDSQNIPSSEYNALYDLYNSTNGPYWQYGYLPGNKWNFTGLHNPCSEDWAGIVCTENWTSTCYVSALSLNNMSLIGALPASIGSFSKATIISLTSNNLASTLPSQLGLLLALSYLDLSVNKFFGDIPTELGLLTQIEKLDLSFNSLVGVLPSELCGNAVLTTIDLANNELWGRIPACWWRLPGLISLNVSENSLSGTFPKNATMGSIRSLFISDNHFTGVLPSLNNMTNLTFLDLSNNSFSGQLDFYGLSTIAILDASQNKFTGNLNRIVNDPSVASLVSIDVSDNQLTGTLPASLFMISSLTTFAAISNCFSGSVPREICSSLSLQSIVMDALSSVCRTPVLPYVNSKAYLLAERVSLSTDTFQCILELPQLEAFYYAGNSAQVSFPDNASIVSSVFSTLSMGHNQMGGTVPTYIFRNKWDLLDLSYNRLSGLLQPVHLIDNQSTIYLEVNRFSGIIPGTFMELKYVNILRDNMFSCSLSSHQDLPVHDPKKKNYICGSDSTNEALIAWGLAFLVILVMVQCTFGIRVLVRSVQDMVVFNDAERHLNRGSVQLITVYLHVFEKQQASVRRNVFLTLCSILFVFVPLYCGMSATYSIFTYKYGWYPSALFNAGRSPAIVLIVSLSIFLVQVHCLFRSEIEEAFIGSQISKVAGESISDTVHNIFKFVARRYFLSWRAILVLIVDVALIGGITGGYIYISMRYSHQATALASVFVALTKALWNGPILKAFIEALRMKEDEWKLNNISHTTSKPIIRDLRMRPTTIVAQDAADIDVEMTNSPFADVSSPAETAAGSANTFSVMHIPYSRESVESWRRHLSAMLSISTLRMLDFNDTYHRDLRFRLYLGFLNSIILPCIATALVSTSCFNELLYPNSTVSATYTRVCSVAFADTDCVVSVGNVTFPVGSSTPETIASSTPFVYSYQCASIVLKSFAPVYISSAIITGFLFPAVSFVVDKILLTRHEHLAKSSPSLLRFLEILHFLVSTTKSKSRAIRMIQDLKDRSSASLVKHGSVFRKDVHLALITNGIAELVTFGVLMPIVGFVVGISIITQTFVANQKVAELLLLFKEHNVYFGIDLMGRECESLPQTISNSIATISSIASGFWCFLVFDQYGDQVGFNRAIIVVLWMFFPLVLPVTMSYIQILLKNQWKEHNEEIRGTESEFRNTDIELPRTHNEAKQNGVLRNDTSGSDVEEKNDAEVPSDSR
jgi:hypothetical protein